MDRGIQNQNVARGKKDEVSRRIAWKADKVMDVK